MLIVAGGGQKKIFKWGWVGPGIAKSKSIIFILYVDAKETGVTARFLDTDGAVVLYFNLNIMRAAISKPTNADLDH